MAVETRRTFAEIGLPRQNSQFREIERAVVIAAHLRIVEVLHVAGEVHFGLTRSYVQSLDVGMIAGQDQRRVPSPGESRTLPKTRAGAAHGQVRFILAPKK